MCSVGPTHGPWPSDGAFCYLGLMQACFDETPDDCTTCLGAKGDVGEVGGCGEKEVMPVNLLI